MADSSSNDHSVRIETLDFEGPLDLLVYLVQKNEVDIWDIPIALITEQFLGFLDAMTPERLESAGEFLLMAATLLRIKARMLLPRSGGEDEEELEDPRRELVLKIIEYQQFKEIAEHLRGHEGEQRRVFPRATEWVDEWLAEEGEEPPRLEPEERRATLTDLLRAFAVIMRQAERERIHHLETLPITIEEKARFVRERLRREGHVTFAELFVAAEPREFWIVTFVALLELAREGEIRLRQGEAFGEIHVFATERLGRVIET
jgi:segregation and condensation protein A